MVATFPALAADPVAPNLSQLTDKINFDDVMVAIMAIAASLSVLYACWVGVRWVLRIVRSA
ncbi:MAG: hypothetical protein RR575_09040 [Acinetobacter sp.]